MENKGSIEKGFQEKWRYSNFVHKEGKLDFSGDSYPSFLPLYGQISTALIELSTGRKGEIMVQESEEQDRGRRDG